MAKQIIFGPRKPRAPLSPAVKAGDFIFVSGQPGDKDDQGRDVQGIEAQTKQCLENIRRVLEAGDTSMNDVVKVTVFLTKAKDFAKMNEVYQTYFPKDYPARSTFIVGLAIPAMLIEIECIAYHP